MFPPQADSTFEIRPGEVHRLSRRHSPQPIPPAGETGEDADRVHVRQDLVLPGTNTVTFPHPFVVSLSNLERSHVDKLSANGGSQ